MKSSKKLSNITPAMFLVVILLALVQIFIAHQLVTAGKKVGELEKLAAKIEIQNEKLKEEINQNGSLVIVSQRAEKLGFKKANDLFYLTSEVPVALGF
jgi:cell division protein FtsL